MAGAGGIPPETTPPQGPEVTGGAPPPPAGSPTEGAQDAAQIEAAIRAEGDEAALQDLDRQADLAAASGSNQEAADNLAASAQDLREVPSPGSAPELTGDVLTDHALRIFSGTVGEARELEGLPTGIQAAVRRRVGEMRRVATGQPANVVEALRDPAGAPLEQPQEAAAEAPDAETVREVSRAMRDQQRERLQEKAAEYRDMNPDDLSANLQQIRGDRDLEQSMLIQTNMTREERRETLQRINALKAEEAMITKIQKEKPGQGSGENLTQVQIQANEQAWVEKIGKKATMSADDLDSDLTSLNAQKEVLEQRQRQVQGGDAKLVESVNNLLANVNAEIAATETLANAKKGKGEAESREQEGKQSAEALEEARRKSGTPEELQADVGAGKNNVDSLAEQIKSARGQLKDLPPNAPRRAELEKEIAELSRQEVAAREKLVKDREALQTAQERVRKEADSSTAEGKENIRNLSPDEYRDLTPDQKQERLLELARVLPRISDANYESSLKTKIANGENLSQDEMGQLVTYASAKLLKGDRSVLETVSAATAHYSEIGPAVLKHLLSTREANNALAEANPSDWEKILRFASKHKSWLLILLAIVAGAVALPAAGGVAIAAGKLSVSAGRKLA